jgi:hypothetical protein
VTEEPLGGGNNAREVVRVGGTVHRARDAGSGFAARVLAYLESAGYPYAPRYLGVDDGGRDILSYIPGQTTDHPSQRADGAYARGGVMLRLLHETTAGHLLAAGRVCVLHGDPGRFNTIFWQGLPAAFIDWSSCRPGDRLDDLGYLAWTWCIQSLGHVPIAEQARHLRELRDGYGIAALAVGVQLADRDTCGQLVGLLRRVDHLGEQENVTLHRQAGPRPELTASASGAGNAATPGPPGGRTIR